MAIPNTNELYHPRAVPFWNPGPNLYHHAASEFVSSIHSWWIKKGTAQVAQRHLSPRLLDTTVSYVSAIISIIHTQKSTRLTVAT